jgi:DNA-binding transcriptional regulator LsrR (DeoR family)
MERLIHESNLGREDETIATLYLIDGLPQIDIAVTIPLDRSTVSRRVEKIIRRLIRMEGIAPV